MGPSWGAGVANSLARSAGGVDRADEDARQEALTAYGILDADHVARPELRSLVGLAADACGVPMATLNFFTRDEQVQVESVGFEGGVSPREDSMCDVVLDDREPVVLADASQDPRFQDNPWVVGPASVRFYATFQLRTPAEVALGTLCVFDTAPREIGPQDRERLELIAARVVDVLELEIRARRLRTVNDTLVVANSRLDQFAAAVSHDLRSPLGTLFMVLGLVEESLPVGEVHARLRDLVDRALHTADRMAGTIEHLLNTYAEGSDLVGAVSDVLWYEQVLGAVDDLAVELAGSRLRVDAPAGATALTVQGHATGLRLIVQNLLSNAARYAVPHDPRIEVVFRPGATHDDIDIVDHGPGIPAQDHARVFERGSRFDDPSRDGTTVGKGLGLATSRQLAVSMGGRLTLTPTPGGGATFSVRLEKGADQPGVGRSAAQQVLPP